MIEETAIVESCQGQHAWVSTQRQSTCGACAANKVCGTATLAKVLGSRRTRVQILTNQPLQAGQTIVIGLNESALVRGALALYLTPLLALFMGAVAAQSVFGHDVAALLGGIVGIAVGLMWVKRFTRRIQHDARYQPVFLRQQTPPAPLNTLTNMA